MLFKHKALVLFLLFAIPCLGQKLELGLGSGFTHYKGDISPRIQPLDVGLGANVFFRYNTSRALSFKTALLIGRVQANEADNSDLFQKNRAFSFKDGIREISIQAEYNFLNYLQGTSKFVKNWTPYLGGGLCYLSYTPIVQGSTGITQAVNNQHVFVLPLSFGFKKQLKGPWTWGLELGTRFALNDNLDGLSFKNNADLYALQDRDKLANTSTNDVYYYSNLSLSYTFYKVKCPY